ncbi:hypothetical protein DVH24_022364 [Malus domestica]|uniref:Uncharacterized protein n=1 Tax=Malus domestica TaxID=3750 RepID=A0A498KIV9_MALDO|nr:hypothetical protein DVH24_022364 [Malus domestica]
MGMRVRAMGAPPDLIRSLQKEAHPKPANPQSLPSQRRAFSLYDQINLIDNVPSDQLRFQRTPHSTASIAWADGAKLGPNRSLNNAKITQHHRENFQSKLKNIDAKPYNSTLVDANKALK